MRLAIAFDVYGTLIDPSGVVDQLQIYLGKSAKHFSDSWRATQISYSFRRSILNEFAPFTQCTRDALEATCTSLKVNLSSDQKDNLMQKYLELPAFPGVKEVLGALVQQGQTLYAFSNGADSDLEALFQFAGIRDLFTDLISVGPTEKFKPDPVVYQYLRKIVGKDIRRLIFVSSNPFDVQGASKAGLYVAWLNRDGSKFDPWGPQPALEIGKLSGLLDLNLAE